jgi:hypothetical protein
MSPILKAFLFTLVVFAITIAISLIVGAIIKLIGVIVHRSQKKVSAPSTK